MSEITFSTVQEFIVAYYKTFVYEPESIYKFYDDKAQISRQNFDDKSSRILEEAKEHLIPDCVRNVQIAITNCSFCSAINGTNIIVNGAINPTSNLLFNQFFTLKKIGEKIYIVADTFRIIDTSIKLSDITSQLEICKVPKDTNEQ